MAGRIYIVAALFFFIHAVRAQDDLKHAVAEAKKTQQFAVDKVAYAEQLLRTSGDERTNMDARVMLGNTYKSLEQHDIAYRYYTEALRTSLKYKLDKKTAYIEGEMGAIQLNLGNNEAALRLFKEALSYQVKINYRAGIIKEKGNIAVVQINIGQTDDAIATLYDILAQKDLQDGNRSVAYLTLGNIYMLSRPDPSRAVKYYIKALGFLEKDDRKHRILVLQNLAESYIALKQYNKALTCNKESEIMLKEADSNEMRASLYLFYSQIAKARSNYREAFENMELYEKYKALINKEDTRRKIDNIEAAKKIKQQQNDLKIRTQKIKLLEQERTLEKIKNAALVLLLCGFAVFIFIMAGKYKNKVRTLGNEIAQTNDKLEFSQATLDKMALSIKKNNEFAERFQQDLRDVQGGISDRSLKQELSGLILELQNFKIINDNRAGLSGSVGANFLYNLEKKIPGLTNEEKQICTLIYLNMKNKDIALLMNLSVRSIENSRYRIRKKIGLDTSGNLSDYIKSL